MPGTVLHAECAENNTGVVLSTPFSYKASLTPSTSFYSCLFEFASKQPLFGTAVCWHAFFAFFKFDF